MSREITYEEVSKHNDKNSVWMVIHENVYDVTSFLEEHPGGADSLLDVAGRESTQEFDDIGHSEDAKEMLKKYKIGSLAPGEVKPKQTKMATTTSSGGTWKYVLALASAVLIGIALKKYISEMK